MNKKLETLISPGIKSIEQFFLEFNRFLTNRDNMWIYLHAQSSMWRQSFFFDDRMIRWANAAVVSLIVKLNSIPSAFRKFSDSSGISVPFSTQNFLGGFFFVIVQKSPNRFFGILCYRSLCIYGPIKQVSTNYWYFTPLLSLASLSKHANCIRQISFWIWQ